MNIIKTLLGLLAPALIEKLTNLGIPEATASTAVKSASDQVATEHENAQDRRLNALEARVEALERQTGRW